MERLHYSSNSEDELGISNTNSDDGVANSGLQIIEVSNEASSGGDSRDTIDGSVAHSNTCVVLSN